MANLTSRIVIENIFVKRFPTQVTDVEPVLAGNWLAISVILPQLIQGI